MTSRKKRKYGDLAAQTPPTIDERVFDEVFEGFFGRRPVSREGGEAEESELGATGADDAPLPFPLISRGKEDLTVAPDVAPTVAPSVEPGVALTVVPDVAPAVAQGGAPGVAPAKAQQFVYLDSTHTSTEQKVYSWLLRQAKRLDQNPLRVSQREVMRALGIGSFSTVTKALKGLRDKLSITEVSRHGQNRAGVVYRVNYPKQILEARERAGLRINPVNKQVIRLGATVGATAAATSGATPGAPGSEELALQKLESQSGRIINYVNSINGDSSPPPSSSHDESTDDEKLEQVKQLFGQLSNGGRWRDERDLEHYERVRHLSLWHIIVGLCYSLVQCPEHRYSTFKYAAGEILDLAAKHSVFPDAEMTAHAYTLMRRTLTALETGKWSVLEWEAGKQRREEEG